MQTNIIGGATAYRRYHARMARQAFSLNSTHGRTGAPRRPAPLRAEMEALLGFKSAVLTDLGFERQGAWGPSTVIQRRRHLALMFGALAAAPDGPARGLGRGPRPTSPSACWSFPRCGTGMCAGESVGGASIRSGRRTC
ncbi:hypothetical protein [Brevundimonas denitrificans]|uniref:hypothetical protein n=1 Tax=Brevundimonas denitrificans TaxID=1443434 RepID=UPI00223B7FC3|nr:hypothetical protein [Brevundimonas denitrificans]